MVSAILRKLGISEGESRIYDALLDIGGAPLNKIHEAVGIERRNIYDILNKLIERGFVTYIVENKKRIFRAAHPTRLLGYLDERQTELERTKNAIAQELPTLLHKFAFTHPTINAEIYRGAEGVKAVWDDFLNYPDIRWIGAGRYMPKQFPHYFASWNRRRLEKKFKIFNLLRYELKREIRKPYALEYLRFLPKEFSGNPTVLGIYGNKTVQILYGKELFAFVIESEDLAENYRAYHKYLWENVAKS